MSTLKGLGNDVSSRGTRLRTVDTGGADVVVTTAKPTTTTTTTAELHDVESTRTVVGATTSTPWSTAGAGADTALQGLVVAEESGAGKKFRAGVAGALTALALVGTPALAQSDGGAVDLQGNTAASTLVVTPQTSPLSTRLLQLTTDKSEKTKAGADAAFARFDDVVETLLHRNAVGLSSGKGPLDDSSQLTPDERKQLEGALKNLVKELPIASLSPQMAQLVADLADRGGVTVDAGTTRIKDLGHVGGDIAKRVVDELRRERPAVFWGTAGAIAVAAGVGSAIDGSHVLRAIGVKPEVKLKLLDDKVTTKIGLDWGKRFQDPVVHAGVSAPITVGPMSGEMSATVDVGGARFSHMHAVGYTLSASLSDGGAWSAGMTVTGWPQDNRYQAGLGVGYHPNKDVEAFLQASHDTKGDTAVGLGVRIRW